MNVYAAEPQNHPENETDTNWSNLIPAIADQAGSLIVIALVAMLAVAGGTILIYTVARQRRTGRFG